MLFPSANVGHAAPDTASANEVHCGLIPDCTGDGTDGAVDVGLGEDEVVVDP